MALSQAAALHGQLKHPVIDSDGHWLEFGPLVVERMEKIGGAKAVEGFRLFGRRVNNVLNMGLDQRRARRHAQQAWWALPAKNTRDRATGLFPRLLYERLDEFGLDFTVLYPTAGLGVPFIPDADTRHATCRAFNIMVAELFGEFADRITPAAVIPMHTPQEAIAELEHASRELGLKVALMASMVRRPLEAVVQKNPEAARYAGWFDMIGLDSDYDYDPLWAKCVELGVSPTFHTGSRGSGLRVSPSNFTYNHIGHFAAAGEAVCKAIFMGGVTRRFPTLNFAFLEGGVGWACSLYSDLIGHWKKRNPKALEETNPANLDRALLAELGKRYGGKEVAAAFEKSQEVLENEAGAAMAGAQAPEIRDDYGACGIERPQDIKDLFTRTFYFGCEADDPMNAWAFNAKVNPYGARLKTLFGSDIGHFDVPDMSEVLLEAHELVDEGLINQEDFREFVFTNPARFWAENNPRFFKGTAVEKQVEALLAAAK